LLQIEVYFKSISSQSLKTSLVDKISANIRKTFLQDKITFGFLSLRILNSDICYGFVLTVIILLHNKLMWFGPLIIFPP